ncbi:MAG: SAM-dependent methyltransferase [Pseudomonadota bacterium]
MTARPPVSDQSQREPDLSPVERLLRSTIEAEGPQPVAVYMALCLNHSAGGYYAAHPGLGAEGDFITAPELTSLFGEMIALFALQSWIDLGEPSPFDLIELGPGSGVLMADLLNTAKRLRPGFIASVRIRLIEQSPLLAKAQIERLQGLSVPITTAPALTEPVAETPFIVLANEFLDALPIRQFQRTALGWHERLIGLAPSPQASGPEHPPGLAFVLSDPLPHAGLPFDPSDIPNHEGAIAEIAPSAENLIAAIGESLATTPGRALFIDYGSSTPQSSSTLQAVRQHRFVDCLTSPGAADLSAHVPFWRLKQVAHKTGARVDGPATQQAFLGGLGIELRAARARAHLQGSGADALSSALSRLIDAQEMGHLFKALCLSAPTLGPAPGFGPETAP